VAVGPDGHWNCAGWHGESPDELMAHACEVVSAGEARYWLTATLPVPEAQTVRAEVEKP
jgi:hypothetical protein